MMSKRAKVNAKLSAYDPDFMSLDVCKKSVNWEYPRHGNSRKQAIMNEIENLKKFDMFKIIPLSSISSGAKIFSIATGYVTKRAKASTPEHEKVDKRKCRMCLGGHKAIEGAYYNRIDTPPPCLHGRRLNCSLLLPAGIICSSRRLIASPRTSRPISRIPCMYTHQRALCRSLVKIRTNYGC